MQRLLFLVLISLVNYPTLAQDSVQIMGLNDFLHIVREFHPVARQAQLKTEIGAENLKAKKGAFDPYLTGNVYQKYFDNKQYYDLLNAGMTIPTWFGIELNAGFEQTDGVYLNPQNNTPTHGLAHAGISVPIGQDLFIDQRRADLKKAKIYTEITEVEQRLMQNELLKNATLAYWDWVGAEQQLAIYQEGVALAATRFNAVTQSALIGEAPIIDTVEAYIQYQNRVILLQEAELNQRNSRLQLSVYLWNSQGAPLTLTDKIIPPPSDSLNTMGLTVSVQQLDSFINNHPKLVQNQLKLDQLNIERRLKVEQIKPKLDLKYNALNEPLNGDPLAAYSVNNYTWGVAFKMPVFLRKARGELQLTNLEIQNQQLYLDQTQRVLNYNVSAAINQWQTAVLQLNNYRNVLDQTQRLREAEVQKFDAGESSLFLVNQRETRYINTQTSYIQYLIKAQKALMKIEYELGVLN